MQQADVNRRQQQFLTKAQAEKPAYQKIISLGGSRGGGGTTKVLWATIIVAVADMVPEAPEGSAEYAGNNFAIARLLTDNYSTFDPEHLPAYTKGQQLIDSFDNRVYTVTADVVTNMGLYPHENSGEWALYDEYKIEYAWGRDTDGDEVPLKNIVPRYPVGAIVKLVSREIPEGATTTTRHYIDCGTDDVGDYAERTIGYINGKLSALWRDDNV